MNEVNLFENITFLKDISINEFLLFFLYLFLIFFAKWVLQFVFQRVSKSDSYQKRIAPTIHSILNWLALYGGILLFLFYFSRESWLFYPFYETEDVEVTLFLIIMAIIIVSLANRMVKLFNTHAMPFIYDQFSVETGMRYTFNRIIYYTVMFLAIAISFTTVGLDLRALGVIFSVLGIGIGFGMRNVAANFVSGIIIIFERPIEVGERVYIDGRVGKVAKIRLRSTVVETFREGNLIVPNQHFIEQIIKNQSRVVIMAEVQIGVQYGTDTQLVESLLADAVKREMENVKGVLLYPEPDIRFVDFKHQSMEFQVLVPVDSIPAKEQMESRLRHAIAELFFGNDIRLAEFPPQLEE